MDVQENRKEHMLKTDPAVFQDVLDGSKTFEIRFNDRGYQVDDLIVLKETKFTGQQMKSGQPLVYTGREIQKRISYVLSGYGLQEDWVILGIQDIEAAKAQAVPEGFVLVPVKEIKTWYLDDSDNIYREDPEWLCDIPVGEVVEVEHRVSYELDQDPVFAAIQWDEENSDVGYYETFKSKVEAEKVAAHCKAMVEAQEPTND